MLIDINTYIGHWPFRQVKNMTPGELVKVMDEAGIDVAAVSSMNSVFYRDAQQGNEELAEQIAPYKGRFLPFAIINPVYTGWKKDFVRCVETLKMRGLELYPCYHRYELANANCVELVKLAGEMKIPVHLPCAIENIRQRHWMDVEENLSLAQVEQILKLCPDTDFIITNGATTGMAQYLAPTVSARKGRVYYDFARVDAFLPEFRALIEAAGADRVVFGSVAPLQYIDPQLVKLHFGKLDNVEREKIMSGNLKELFKL